MDLGSQIQTFMSANSETQVVTNPTVKETRFIHFQDFSRGLSR